jgi:hydroxymethylglutaryl-CoA reductase
MNGIDAAWLQDKIFVLLKTCVMPTLQGMVYRSLTKWYKTRKGDLVGELELPIAVGIVGERHQSIQYLNRIKDTGCKNCKRASMVLSAVGLAQNMAALRALASEGIQKGHMRLHARNIAYTAGCQRQSYLIW